MNCPQCNYGLGESDTVCPRCATDAQQEAQAPIPPPDPEMVELEHQYRSAYKQMMITYWLGFFCLCPIWIWTLVATNNKNALRMRVATKGTEVQRWVDRVENRKDGARQYTLWFYPAIVTVLLLVLLFVGPFLLEYYVLKGYTQGLNGLMNSPGH